MIELFEDLIFDLGAYLGLPLYIDKGGSCLINIEGKLDLYLEWIAEVNEIRIVVELIELAESALMEKVFLAALRANNREYPRYGNLAYSEVKKTLVLFEQLPLSQYQGEEFADFLEKFVDHAMDWLQSIENGHPSPVEYFEDSDRGIFGL